MGRLRIVALCGALLTAACSAESGTTPTSTSPTSAVTSSAPDGSTASETPPTFIPSTIPSATDDLTVPSTTDQPSTTGQPPATTSLTAVQPAGAPVDVVTGLAAPWSVVFVGTGAEASTLISERDSGVIREITGASTREIGTVAGVVHQGEGGLLGLAVLADATQPYLYSYFTSADDNRIVRYPLTGAAGSRGLGAAEPVLSGIPKAGNHNGGRIAFGPDGKLYVTAGDAGESDNAQDPDSLSGKILRLDPDGSVPDDNPIAGNPMYSMGHRNPRGIAWDAQGTMWSSEFGQNTWDELNIITAGANYGWPVVEGIDDSAEQDGFVNPVQQWPTDDASPSGIAIAGGTVFIANLKGERLRAVPIGSPSESTEYYVGGYGRLRDVAVVSEGPVGSSAASLFILTNNTDGRGDPRDGDDRLLTVALTTA